MDRLLREMRASVTRRRQVKQDKQPISLPARRVTTDGPGMQQVFSELPTNHQLGMNWLAVSRLGHSVQVKGRVWVLQNIRCRTSQVRREKRFRVWAAILRSSSAFLRLDLEMSSVQSKGHSWGVVEQVTGLMAPNMSVSFRFVYKTL